MRLRSALNFLPLMGLLFFACNPFGSASMSGPKSYYPSSGYQKVDENTWFAHNKKGIPYIPELRKSTGEYERLSWRDAQAYSRGELLALTADRGNGLETPKVVHLTVGQIPRVIFGGKEEEFPQRFSRILLDAQDYGIDGPEEELALVMRYGNKESILIINPRTMTPAFRYESDDISLISQPDGKVITGVSYESGTPLIEAYRWNGENYIKTEVPQEINLTDEMVESIEQNKNDLISATLSNPQEAIGKTQQILGTDNPLLVSTALQFATRDVYVVDEKESKPLWQYLVEYDVGPGEARARVAVDPLVAYVALNKIGIGQTPLPWANNEPLAVVFARSLSQEPGNTYLNLRLTRKENGKLELEGDIEPGERLVKVSGAIQVYAPVLQEEADKIQRDLGSGLSQGKENVKQFLKERNEIAKEKQQESQQQTEELKQKAREGIMKGQQELQQQQEKAKQQADELKRRSEEEANRRADELREQIRRQREEAQRKLEEQKRMLEQEAEEAKKTICDNLPKFIPKPEACK